MLAQSADPFTGVFGTVIQLGSFGLLAYIVYALVVIVPKRMDKADALREKEALAKVKAARYYHKAAEIREKSNQQTVDKLLKAFAEQQRYEREECEKGRKEQMEQLLKTHEVVREIRHEQTTLAQIRANEKAAAELKKAPKTEIKS